MENKHNAWDLAQMQSLPLKAKIQMTKYRIREWYEAWDGMIYISFSGGKDSTVLLDIVRNVCGYKDVPAVFVDTGLEYPEIREFVKGFENIVWLKPEMQFKKVIEKYGYPFISKEISGRVAETRNWLERQNLTWSELLDAKNNVKTDGKMAYAIANFLGIDRRGAAKNSEEFRQLKQGKIPIRTQYLLGIGENPNTGKLSPYNAVKWAFLLESKWKISNQCCAVMKKKPMHKYANTSGRYAITGQMADESRLRMANWIKYGCNMYDATNPISNPMSFWTEQDVLAYIKENHLEICSVYGDIVEDNSATEDVQGQMTIFDIKGFEEYTEFDAKRLPLKTTGCDRTGCMFCGYGCHLEKGIGRFERMKQTHPKQYEWIMKPWEEGGLGYKEIIDWLNEQGNLNIKY